LFFGHNEITVADYLDTTHYERHTFNGIEIYSQLKFAISKFEFRSSLDIRQMAKGLCFMIQLKSVECVCVCVGLKPLSA